MATAWVLQPRMVSHPGYSPFTVINIMCPEELEERYLVKAVSSILAIKALPFALQELTP